MIILGRRIDDRNAVIWTMWASAIALLAALGSQYLGGLAPCKLCIWQRAPHGIAIAIGLIAFMWFRGTRQRIFLTWLVCLTFAVGAGIALYHTGVEQHWIAKESSCTGLESLSKTATLDDLRAQLLATPIIRCDEVPWSLFGVSIAGWNAVASLTLMVFCGTAALNQSRRRFS